MQDKSFSARVKLGRCIAYRSKLNDFLMIFLCVIRAHRAGFVLLEVGPEHRCTMRCDSWLDSNTPQNL